MQVPNEKQDNYRLSRDRAQAYFLGFDQRAVITVWQLHRDEAWLYTENHNATQ